MRRTWSFKEAVAHRVRAAVECQRNSLGALQSDKSQIQTLDRSDLRALETLSSPGKKSSEAFLAARLLLSCQTVLNSIRGPQTILHFLFILRSLPLIVYIFKTQLFRSLCL